MGRSYAVSIGSLAAIWGASYLFIKVAVRDVPPAAMMEVRLALSGVVLASFVVLREGRRRAVADLRRAGWQAYAIGVVNGAVPFTLIAWGERHVDSGVAAVANASVPIFNAALAPWLLPKERIGGLRLLGVLVGLVGVAVLTVGQPHVSWWLVAGPTAVVLASFSYALGAIWAQHALARGSGPTLAAAAMLGGALVLLPLALFSLPSHVPGWKAAASLLALTLGGTAVAQLILYRALRVHGAARVGLVTYLMPPIALLYGALLLDESLTLGSLAGLALILGGVAVGSGGLRVARRRPAVAEP